MISPNIDCPSIFYRDFFISVFIYMIKKSLFLTRRLIYSDSAIRNFTDIHSGPEFPS